MGLFGSNIYIMSIISYGQCNFESLKQYYFGKPYICWCVQSHPEDRGDFGQGSTENISECNNQLELSVYNMWCSYMIRTNSHMKPRIGFIIMKIFMKIVKICPKSPWFTVVATSSHYQSWYLNLINIAIIHICMAMAIGVFNSNSEIHEKHVKAHLKT